LKHLLDRPILKSSDTPFPKQNQTHKPFGQNAGEGTED